MLKAGQKTILLFLPLFLSIIIGCERNDYELLDPELAGTWTVYTTSDGLPSDNISDIYRDSKGNLWFSFPGFGIARYDYKGWTYFRTTTSPLVDDNVNCMAGSAEGKILFGTYRGISVLSVENTWSSELDAGDTLDITAIKITSDGALWVGTRNSGFFVNTGAGFVNSTIAGFENVRAIEEGHSGAVYIGTEKGLVRWYNKMFTFIRKTDGLPDDRVTALKFDRRERLWIGTDAGNRVVWSGTDGTLHQVNLMTGNDSIKIRDIFEDRRGHVWFATRGNGLIWYNGVVPRSFKEFSGISAAEINCIEEDKYGNLWIGLRNKGLVKYVLPIE